MAPRTSIARGHGGRKPIQRAVAYVRVSSEEQAQGDRFSLPAQRREIGEYAQRKGWEIVAWYADEGVSGRSDTITKRPGLQQLLEDTAHGIADVVIVHDVSRWARNRAVFYDTLGILGQRHIAFASVREDIDYSTPEGQMFLSILANFAAYFSDALAAHTSKGKHERARQGYYNGDLPYGYANPTPGRAGEYNKTVPAIVEEEAAAVRLAFDTYAGGTATDASVAALLNQRGYRVRHKHTTDSRTGRQRNPERLWTKDTVCKLLKNPFYTGVVRYKGEEHRGQHPALIDADLFGRCQEVRARRQHGGAGMVTTGRTYLLKGIAYCAGCQTPMRCDGGRATHYYRCAADQRGVSCPATRRVVRGVEADAAVAGLVGRLHLPDDWRRSIVAQLAEGDAARDAQRRQELLEAKLRRLRQMYADMEMSRPEYEAARDAVTTELAGLVVPEATDLERAGAMLERLGGLWDAADPDERHALAAELFDAVYLDPDTARIAEVRIKPDYAPLFAGGLMDGSGTDGIRTRDLDIDSVAC